MEEDNRMKYKIIENKSNYNTNFLDSIIIKQLSFLKGIFNIEEYNNNTYTFYFVNDDVSLSEVVDNKIVVNTRKDIDEELQIERIRIIVRHELVHIFSEVWGYPCPLFFEGTAIYYSDNLIRKERLGYDYHALCRAFLENDVLLPLDNYLLPRKFYSSQPDYRILIETGSFYGFLLDYFGFNKVRKVYEDYKCPTIDEPVMMINPLLKSIFNKDLTELQSMWKNYLQNQVVENVELSKKYTMEFFREAGFNFRQQYIHCNICHYPFSVEKEKCPNCGADRDIVVKVI